MKSGKVTLQEILKDSLTIKPNFHLNFGKFRLANYIKNGGNHTTLISEVEDIYRPGIFKRVFVEKEENGFKYITASSMMQQNPLESAKLISKKYTPWIDQMSLRPKEILVSCAGTIGNIRLITDDLRGIIGSQDIIRVAPHDDNYGYIYAYLSSPTCFNYLQSLVYGSVVPRLDPIALKKLPIPLLSEEKQKEIHQLIVDAAQLRVKANRLLEEAVEELKKQVELPDLTKDDYEYFGNYSSGREISAFTRNSKELSSLSINAFNYSRRVESLENRIKTYGKWSTLKDVLQNGAFFSTGSFPRLELQTGKSIQLINQSDIFDINMKGKLIARKFVKTDKLVEYGEVLIAGVGTLGENETFCRVIFANEELEGKLVSGEFIRMKSTGIPSGYLYAFLSTDYAFRMIRKTQTGTKLCRPIQALLSKIPVPLLDSETMNEIDKKVRKGQTYRYNALQKETQAIQQIENEIASWQVS